MNIMTSLTFLYVLLPAAMAVFLLCPPAWRPGAVLLFSLGCYLAAQPGYFFPLMACVSADWLCLGIMSRLDGRPKLRLACAVLCASKSVLLLAAAETLLQASFPTEPVLGLRVYCVSSLSCVLESYRRKAPHRRTPLSLALYYGFFPRLEAGPLMSYRDFSLQLRTPNPSLTEIAGGLGLFLQGAVKAGVLGTALKELYDVLRAFPSEEVTVASAWCALLVLALSVYYRLSGFAAMAQGVARMMGLKLPQNFYFPYQSRGVCDFFERFNMTLTAFLRVNVREPLERRKNAAPAGCLGMALTGALFGLWFGLRINCLAWGGYLAFFAILERYAYPGLLKRMPTLFIRGYSLCVVLSSFALFGEASLADSAATFARMFSFGDQRLFNPRLGYLLSSNWLLLAVSLLFATSAVSLLMNFLKKNLRGLHAAVSLAAGACLLVVFTVFSL